MYNVNIASFAYWRPRINDKIEWATCLIVLYVSDMHSVLTLFIQRALIVTVYVPNSMI